MEKFSKFFIASLKRTAQNVAPLVRKKNRLHEEIAKKEEELKFIQTQMDVYEAAIKEVTGGYSTEDLIERIVETTDKTDKDGKPVKITKWVLKYPDTIIPPAEEPKEEASLTLTEDNEVFANADEDVNNNLEVL